MEASQRAWEASLRDWVASQQAWEVLEASQVAWEVCDSKSKRQSESLGGQPENVEAGKRVWKVILSVWRPARGPGRAA